MIKNDRQYKYTKNNLVRFKKDLKIIQEKYSMNKDKVKFLSRGIIEHVKQLEKEMEEYEHIRNSPLPDSLKTYELHKISQNLAKFRIARGITQKQVAKKVGCKQSDISRLEREGYCGYTINQLYKIARAINVKIEINLIPEERISERNDLIMEIFVNNLESIKDDTSDKNLWNDIAASYSYALSADEDKFISFEEGKKILVNA